MTPSDGAVQSSALKRIARSRSTRFTAATVAVGLAAGAIVTAGGGSAGAATTRAQSVGRFLDGSAGGMALQSLVDLKDARRTAPKNKAAQRQGLNASLLNAVEVPVGNSLKLPGGGAFNLGAANQIAFANTNGMSYGASGAVENNGGVQLTDKDGQFPAGATIDLSGAALGKITIPGLGSIPGLPSGVGGQVPSVTSLGGVKAKIGAIQALAQTKTGGGNVKPQSSVADLQLVLGSPALGTLLSQLNDAFSTQVITGLSSINPTLGAALSKLTGFKGCSLSAPATTKVTLEGGGVIINPKTATITVDLGILLKRLAGVDIAHLKTSNFDLVKFLVKQLPSILSTGLERIVNGLTGSLESQFSNCSMALAKALSVAGIPLPGTDALTTAFKSLQKQVEDGINTVVTQLTSAGGSGLTTLADGLTGAVDIGLNVQSGPKIQPHDTNYKYSTKLKKTPDQATPVVKHQSLVRAIEIDLLDASASATGTGSAASLALGNAAAGPSVAAPTVSVTTSTPTTPTNTTLPTGVPAGEAGHSNGGGSPLLPAALLLVGLVVAGGGVLSFRMRGRFTR